MCDTSRFRTQTDFITRNNGTMPGIWPVAIDIGYSAVKLMSPNRAAIFPAFAVKSSVSSVFYPDSYIEVSYPETGETWIVGQEAEELLSVSNTVNHSDDDLYGRRRYLSPMCRVLADAALGISVLKSGAGAYSGEKIVIETGLPSNCNRQEDREEVRAVFCGRHHFFIKIGSGKPCEMTLEIGRDDVFFMDQPMGTFWSICYNSDRHIIRDRVIDFLGKNVLILDPGFGTCDVNFIQKGKIAKTNTYYDYGMKAVLTSVSKKISDTYGKDIPVYAMQEYLEKGEFTVRKDLRHYEAVKISDFLFASSREICTKLIDTILSEFEIDKVNYLVVTGGTGAAWDRYIREELKDIPNLKILGGNLNDTLPITFANVRGFYMSLFKQLQADKAKKETA